MSKTTKMERIRALSKCLNAQEVLNEAYKVLGNSILAHDMEYKVLCYVQNIESDDPIWNEFLALGTVTPQTIDFYKNENFIDAAANTNTITFLNTDKLPYNKIFGKLFNSDNIQIGCACITADHVQFEPDAPELFEELCKIISQKMSEENYFLEYGRDYQKRMISTLIEGTFDDKKLYSPHVANIYMGLGAKIFVLCADTSKSKLDFNTLNDYISYFKKIKPEYKYFEYGDFIVIVLSIANDRLVVERDLPQINELFLYNNIYAGISGPFDNLFKLSKYFSQAKRALENGSKQGSNKRIFMY